MKPKCYIMEGGKAPEKSTNGSAGWDVFARETISIVGGGVKTIGVGIKLKCETDEYFRVADRGGHATKRDMHVVAGVIDSDHRGEVKVAIYNTGTTVLRIGEGMKVAQLVLTKINPEDLIFVKELSELGETSRGSKGGIHESN